MSDLVEEVDDSSGRGMHQAADAAEEHQAEAVCDRPLHDMAMALDSMAGALARLVDAGDDSCVTRMDR